MAQGTIIGNNCRTMGSWDLARREACNVPMFLHLPVLLPVQDPFFNFVLCSLRLDFEYTCTLNRVTFMSMSDSSEQELPQCLQADLDFAPWDFIAQHREVAPPAIRRLHASLRNKLMNRLKKRAERGVQSSSIANLNTPQASRQGIYLGCKKHATSTSRQGVYWWCQEHATSEKPPRDLLGVSGTRHKHKPLRLPATRHKQKPPRDLLGPQGTRHKYKLLRVPRTRHKHKPPRDLLGLQGTRSRRHAIKVFCVDTAIRLKSNMPKPHTLDRRGL